jgi:hypothetical protein
VSTTVIEYTGGRCDACWAAGVQPVIQATQIMLDGAVALVRAPDEKPRNKGDRAGQRRRYKERLMEATGSYAGSRVRRKEHIRRRASKRLAAMYPLEYQVLAALERAKEGVPAWTPWHTRWMRDHGYTTADVEAVMARILDAGDVVSPPDGIAPVDSPA